MWERFELFWTAFEKFALFFSFVSTLAILTTMVLIYNAAMNLEPPPEPVPVEPMVETMREGFAKIQDTVLTTTVSISHTVPITLDIRIKPNSTKLELVGKNKLEADGIVIILGSEAGKLSGKEATLELGADNELNVKMSLEKQVVFEVPIQVEVPIRIPLQDVDLGSEIDALRVMIETPTVEPESTPTSDKSAEPWLPSQ